MCMRLEKADFLTGWAYQKMLSENVKSEKAFSDHVRSGFTVCKFNTNKYDIVALLHYVEI